MPVRKTPAADLRRRYPLHVELGLALALGLAVLAFTVPVAPAEAGPVVATSDEMIRLEAPPPTVQTPPPPPPPAPPPPQEVPDTETVVDEAFDEIELTFTDPAPVRSTPPARPLPPAPVDPPEPPPVPDPVPEDPPFFIVVEIEPELIGGLAGLQSRVAYPEMARRAQIEGQVIVQFVVDPEGRVTNAVVLRSPSELLSEAALEAVRESRFTPGQQRGRPVPVRLAVPVTFRLR